MTLYPVWTDYGHKVHARPFKERKTLCGRDASTSKTSGTFDDIDCLRCIQTTAYSYEKALQQQVKKESASRFVDDLFGAPPQQEALFAGPHTKPGLKPASEVIGVPMDKAQTLKAALAPRGPRDPFETGDVVRWTAAGRYTYAAVKTPVGWYTTSDNYRVAKQQTYEELLVTLSESDVSDVVYAATWSEVAP